MPKGQSGDVNKEGKFFSKILAEPLYKEFFFNYNSERSKIIYRYT